MPAIRRPGVASATVLIGLAGCLVVAHAVSPDWSRRAGLDVWNMPAIEEQRSAVAAEREDLVAKADRHARRREVANAVAARLLAGEITLPQAADEVRNLFAEDSGFEVSLTVSYPDVPTERLRFARHMIERASRQFGADPDRDAAVLARLEAEYAAMVAASESPSAP
jgi:hypothetical protein